MLAAERRRVITERIRAAGQVAVSALSAEFQVSEETIRRDLEWLEKEGIATRRYGGAVLTGNDRVAPPYAIRKNTNTELKLILARQLARLVRDGDTLMVDESSTAAYAIRAIRHLHNITLVTNSLELPIEMIGQESWHIISTGGSLLAMESLINAAGGIVSDRIAVLAEGDAQNRADIKFLAPLPLLNADGTAK